MNKEQEELINKLISAKVIQKEDKPKVEPKAEPEHEPELEHGDPPKNKLKPLTDAEVDECIRKFNHKVPDGRLNLVREMLKAVSRGELERYNNWVQDRYVRGQLTKGNDYTSEVLNAVKNILSRHSHWQKTPLVQAFLMMISYMIPAPEELTLDLSMCLKNDM